MNATPLMNKQRKISGNRNKNVYATGRAKGEVSLDKNGSNPNFPQEPKIGRSQSKTLAAGPMSIRNSRTIQHQ